MKSKWMTAEEVRRAGLEALAKALGPADLVRFMQQFDRGTGDYSKERHEWIDNYTVDDLVKQIRARRRKTPSRAVAR